VELHVSFLRQVSDELPRFFPLMLLMPFDNQKSQKNRRTQEIYWYLSTINSRAAKRTKRLEPGRDRN
jgi:hypothetical protein